MHCDVVAERLQRLARKGLVSAFDLLQAHNVRLSFLKPRLEVVHALAD